jgi:hypothetical protein
MKSLGNAAADADVFVQVIKGPLKDVSENTE